MLYIMIQICCIPSFRERSRRPRSMMSGRKQRASILQRRKTPKVWTNSDQYRCNVEGTIFFSIMASRLTEFVMSNQYVDISVQKAGIPGVPGCIEHTLMIWEAIQRAKSSRLSLYVVWLDLANAYGSVPHQLLWKTLEAHHVPQPVIHILQEYFSGFMMRFSTKTYTTRWVPLEVGIAIGGARFLLPSSYWRCRSYWRQLGPIFQRRTLVKVYTCLQ